MRRATNGEEASFGKTHINNISKKATESKGLIFPQNHDSLLVAVVTLEGIDADRCLRLVLGN